MFRQTCAVIASLIVAGAGSAAGQQSPQYAVKPKPDQASFIAMLTRIPTSFPDGDVAVSFCISKTGGVSEVRLLTSSGNPRLDEMVVKNMHIVRFSPARNSDGKPVEICNPPFPLTVVWRAPPH